MKATEKDLALKDSPQKIDAIASAAKSSAPAPSRPKPLTLEVEPTPGDIQPPVLTEAPIPQEFANKAGEVSIIPIVPENMAEAEKVQDMFTKPAPVPAEAKASPVELSKISGEKGKETAPAGKNDDLMSIFNKSEEEDDSGMKELLASITNVNMPEILNEVGAVKELMTGLSQQDWVKAARGINTNVSANGNASMHAPGGNTNRGDVVDAYTLRFVSKGGKVNVSKTKNSLK